MRQGEDRNNKLQIADFDCGTKGKNIVDSFNEGGSSFDFDPSSSRHKQQH
jgi:hypothetical protein